ncbi:hypothetical protein UJ101_01056 [Flavobacteriaceae bacterium UJ101]|nr:hypothetical protein UJ101_01056 [Flavobacteriaceae bacterium UJ101]
MNHLIIIFTCLGLFLKSQNTMTTKYFRFECECIENENYYNPKNQSYNYSYGKKDELSGYLIALRKIISRDKKQQEEYLISIKNSGTFDYRESIFVGESAIIADIFQIDAYGRQIIFFHDNIAYTIMVVSNKKETMERLYIGLRKTFQFQK